MLRAMLSHIAKAIVEANAGNCYDHCYGGDIGIAQAMARVSCARFAEECT